MPITYQKVTQEEVEETAHTLLKCGERLTIALQMMKQEELEALWLPWTAATRRAVDMVKYLGSQAVVEAEDQIDSVRRNRPIRHEVQSRKSRYEAERRARLAEKSQPPQPEDFPPGSLVIDPGPSGGPRIGIVPNPKPSKKPAKKKGSQE